VHAQDGLDEVTLSGKTHISEITGDNITQFQITPADFGLETETIDGLSKLAPAESAKLIRAILSNECESAAARNLVLINAAAAIYIARGANNLKAALAAATESIETGAALGKLRELARATNQ
jgi:anthranilate phosphoribosyltransferase